MNFEFFFTLALIAIAVGMFTYGAFKFWNSIWGFEAVAIRRRAKKLATFETQLNQNGNGILVSKSSFQNTKLEKYLKTELLQVYLEQAGFRLGVKVFIGSFLTSTVIFLIGLMALGLSFTRVLLLIGIVYTVLFFIFQYKRNTRLKKIDNQLPDTLDLMARAMQSGHAFSSALLIVGSEGPEPIRHEFQKTFDEINFGISTESALKNLTLRVSSNELRFFVVAVIIQLETGGNLAGVLTTLAELMRDRQRIAGTVRVLTAEGRISAWILGLLPLAIGSFLSVVNPGFISKLWTDPIGIKMLEVTTVLLVMGVFWMWRMVRVGL